MKKNKCQKLINLFSVFILICIVLLLTNPGNRSESDDGYAYAYLVKTQSWATLFQPRFLLFLPMLKGIYLLLSAVHINIDIHDLMVYFSIACSAITIIIFYFFQNVVLNFNKKSSLWGSLFLLFSYGYWRYSVEAEIYTISNLLCIAVLFVILKTIKEQKPKKNNSLAKIIWAGILAALSICVYKPNAIPVIIVFPFIFILYKRWNLFFVYGITAVVLFVAIFLILYKVFAPPTTFTAYLLEGSSRSYGSPLVTVFVVVSNIFSTNFIYGINTITQFIHNHFPANVITEEIFTAQANGVWNYIAFSTFILAAIIFAIIFIKNFKNIFSASKTKTGIIFIAWIVCYAAILFYLDPNSPEPWTMIILPMITLLNIIFIIPLFQKGNSKLAWLFWGLLILHNYIGGYKLISSESTDFSVHETGWLVKNSQPGDLILSLGSRTTLAYIQYNSPSIICSPEQSFDSCINLANNCIINGKNIYLTQDIFNTDPAVKFRDSITYSQTKSFVEKYRQYIQIANPQDSLHQKVYKLTYNGKLEK